MWNGDSPYPWFDLKAKIHFYDNRGREQFDPPSIQRGKNLSNAGPPVWRASEIATSEAWLWPRLVHAMPDCDINVATLWSTALPVYVSGKGKPVYFMQHYEEVFYPPEPEFITQRLGARSSYGLPIYKVANSSWLQKLIYKRFGQAVPFSNNALVIENFNPGPKLSDEDGVVRVITYSRPEQWKGFADAVAAMEIVNKRSSTPVEWNVFGYWHPRLLPENPFAPYKYHPKLSFTDLAALYSASDIALCPSWYESFPLPPLEAMASGTAVVTTNIGTEDYAFNGKNAVVVGARDIEQMADGVMSLIESPALRQRLSREGRATSEHFTWDRAVLEREQIILDIHNGVTSYDVESSAISGLLDSKRVAFERAPKDLHGIRPTLYWEDEKLYLIFNGTRRQVILPELIQELISRGVEYAEMDELVTQRIPICAPLLTKYDLPDEIYHQSV
jgi:glycosyltransferase involved in cell wall biosynthesis